MIVEVNDFKTSLRLDDTGDKDLDAATDTMLAGYLVAAESYVQDAIGADDEFLADAKNADLVKVCILAVAGAYYQNPVAVTAGSAVVSVNLVLDNIVGQLRSRWEVSQDGATGQSSTAELASGTRNNEAGL